MRSQSGMTLLEMVVAVGLSGVFVCLLSGLLGQTLSLSAASQNDLAAANAADLLLENAKSVPFTQYLNANNPNIPQLPITLYPVATNPPDPPGQLPTYWRVIPFQLDLSNSSISYGTVNGGTGILDQTRQWQPGKGNYFRGSAIERIDDGQPLTGLASGQSICITVTVQYPSNSTTASTRSVTRQAFLFSTGASF